MAKWVFRDPPSTLVGTLRQILDGQLPITEVNHVADEDPEWEFLNWQYTFREEDYVKVALGEIVRLDPTVVGVAELFENTMCRGDVGDEWHQA